MAPPTPIITRDELDRVFALEQRLDQTNCVIRSLTQHNCVFEGGLINCVPFKRLFRECALKQGNGRLRVEITDVNTNKEANEATLFLRAQDKLRKQAMKEQND
ncbi:CYFA0S15e02256g1_1 [Cyberlindnera fabianii]|uniref:CYFA0S15e02256g1_1 n=1 Tax=Cyberlindnera fabianii TaxID=36022 RepID=A0A061B5I0_CYBFA|nr:Protein SOM1, mitochondrial [Cyberlindnera fabianii]CDR44749.1 CYFA0S15e02256g1_1 [Cyberlindnera fabianii]